MTDLSRTAWSGSRNGASRCPQRRAANPRVLTSKSRLDAMVRQPTESRSRARHPSAAVPADHAGGDLAGTACFSERTRAPSNSTITCPPPSGAVSPTRFPTCSRTSARAKQPVRARVPLVARVSMSRKTVVSEVTGPNTAGSARSTAPACEITPRPLPSMRTRGEAPDTFSPGTCLRRWREQGSQQAHSRWSESPSPFLITRRTAHPVEARVTGEVGREAPCPILRSPPGCHTAAAAPTPGRSSRGAEAQRLQTRPSRHSDQHKPVPETRSVTAVGRFAGRLRRELSGRCRPGSEVSAQGGDRTCGEILSGGRTRRTVSPGRGKRSPRDAPRSAATSSHFRRLRTACRDPHTSRIR